MFLISLERHIDASRCSKTLLRHLMMTIEPWFSFLTELPHDLDNLCLHLLKYAVASIRSICSAGRIIITSYLYDTEHDLGAELLYRG